MNRISAINANPTLGRPQVPRNYNVSFTGNAENVEAGVKQAKKAAPAFVKAIASGVVKAFRAVKRFFTEIIPGFFKGIVAHFKPSKEQAKAGTEAVGNAAAKGAETVSKKKLGKRILDGFSSVGAHIKKAAGNGREAIGRFIQNNKGAKGVKLAAAVLTALVAGGFAIKEIHDIATKSNPER